MAEKQPVIDTHFDKIFRFVERTTFWVLLYVVLITFLPIPKENQRFVDIALAFLLGFISSNGSYLTGGNSNTSKKTAEGTTTAEVNITATTSPDDKTN